jgi:hypothetical protein
MVRTQRVLIDFQGPPKQRFRLDFRSGARRHGAGRDVPDRFTSTFAGVDVGTSPRRDPVIRMGWARDGAFRPGRPGSDGTAGEWRESGVYETGRSDAAIACRPAVSRAPGGDARFGDVPTASPAKVGVKRSGTSLRAVVVVSGLATRRSETAMSCRPALTWRRRGSPIRRRPVVVDRGHLGTFRDRSSI